uniref:DUF7041 domain-containing protein n=1 Tax=Trichogramma kaykai TaxID=54128 RepID=A0ABD2WD92_9HYME
MTNAFGLPTSTFTVSSRSFKFQDRPFTGSILGPTANLSLFNLIVGSPINSSIQTTSSTSSGASLSTATSTTADLSQLWKPSQQLNSFGGSNYLQPLLTGYAGLQQSAFANAASPQAFSYSCPPGFQQMGPPTGNAQASSNLASTPVPPRYSNRPIKVPQFFLHDPVLWFKLLESELLMLGITDDHLRYCAMITHCGADVCKRVSAFLKSLPDTEPNKYGKLKQHFVDKFSQTVHQRIEQLLTGDSLDSRKPSELYTEMSALAQGYVPEDTVLLLWYRHLPTQLVIALDEAVTSANAAQAIAKADRLYDRMKHSPSPQICALSNSETGPTLDESLLNRFADTVVAAISTKLNSRSRSTERQDRSQAPRSSSRSRYGDNKDLCYYHHRYQEKARKCSDPPCAWEKRNTFSSSNSKNKRAQRCARRLLPALPIPNASSSWTTSQKHCSS